MLLERTVAIQFLTELQLQVAAGVETTVVVVALLAAAAVAVVVVANITRAVVVVVLAQQAEMPLSRQALAVNMVLVQSDKDILAVEEAAIFTLRGKVAAD
jgi:hypothetical protein